MQTFFSWRWTGIDVHYGLSTPNLLEAKVNRAMMDVGPSGGGGVRFEQIRPAQFVVDWPAFGGTPIDQ